MENKNSWVGLCFIVEFTGLIISSKAWFLVVFAGPFNFEAAKTKGGLPTLHLNPYSWSKVHNSHSIVKFTNFSIYLSLKISFGFRFLV